MRVIFMGTPDFAVPAFEGVLAAGHDVVCTYTQPPRPAGRGHRERPSPIQRLAEARGVAVRTPPSLKSEDEQRAFAALDADIAVVAAYGVILPRAVLEATRLGCVNIHASILPRWRGAAPIQRAILAGDEETGVTIMQVDEGLDSGPIILTATTPIGEETTAGELHDRLAGMGARLIVEALDGLADGTLAPRPQPEEGVTYAKKIERSETRIGWSAPAGRVVRQINAFSPTPGAWFEYDEERIKVLRAERTDGAGIPGMVLDDRLTVACGENAVRLLELQRAGRSAADAQSFLRGFPVQAGTELA